MLLISPTSISRNDPLLVLQSTQRTPDQIVVAAKAYAHTRWQLEEKLRKTLAGANYLSEATVHQSGSRQALLAPVLSSSFYKVDPSPELCLALGLAMRQHRHMTTLSSESQKQAGLPWRTLSRMRRDSA